MRRGPLKIGVNLIIIATTITNERAIKNNILSAFTFIEARIRSRRFLSETPILGIFFNRNFDYIIISKS